MEDEAIISLYNKRSEAAISETDKKYGKVCRGTAYGVLRSSEDAEECVNDTYLKLWGAIPPASPDNLGAYGTRIARNTAINRLKSESAEKRAHTDTVTSELLECIPSDDVDLADKAALSMAISRFLSSETPQKRTIFVRRYFYMDTPHDIARLCRTTETAVRVTLHRLRKKFREYLEKEGFAE